MGGTNEFDDEAGGFADPDPEGDLFAILNAPDRDRCPGARPVVSVSEHDAPEFLAEVDRLTRQVVRLERRGVHLGHMAELDDALMFAPREPLKVFAARFAAARPLVLVGALPPELLDTPPPTAALFQHLGAQGSLAPLLERVRGGLAPEFRVLGPGLPSAPPAADPRDLDVFTVGWREPDPARPSRSADDLWVKLQRLSDHPDDASLRVRVSFGREVDDDASRDLHRHGLVARLAERLFPEVAVLHRDDELSGLVGEWIGGRPLFTQTIAYWNAPNGGALLHHDAFDEPHAGRQRGVLYAQVTGATAWLAASTEDLAAAVAEYADLVHDGTLTDAAAATFGDARALDAALTLAADPRRVRAALAQPDRGPLVPLLHGSPEFAALLADAGHAFVLEAGDACVLPNHGLSATCLHSVFCVGDSPGLAFSLAIRDSRGSGPARDTRRTSRRGRGRGPRRGGAGRARRRRPGTER